MWPEVISAVGGLAVAVVGQAVLFSPESRRVRRLRAYLEIRNGLKDDSLERTLNELIASAIDDEVRARSRTQRNWVITLRVAVWGGLAVIFAAAAFLAWKFLGDTALNMLTVLATALGAIVALANTRRAAHQAVEVRSERSEAELLAAYVDDAASRGLVADADTKGVLDSGFDLFLRDQTGEILEIAEIRRVASDRTTNEMLFKRLRARRISPSARFVAVFGERPSDAAVAELKRLGVDVTYLRADGTFDRLR